MRKIKFISILLALSMLLTVPAFAFSSDFTDVPENAVYAESVSYLADAGVLRRTTSGRFAPNEKITVGDLFRGSLARTLSRPLSVKHGCSRPRLETKPDSSAGANYS